MNLLRSIIIILSCLHLTLQQCPEEISSTGISVTWHETPTANNVESDPQCYHNDTLVRRNCSESKWTPALDELTPCLKIVKYFDLSSCPPGFNKVTEENNDYCYQIGEPSAWDYPCLSKGGASVISDISSADITHLVKSLRESNTSRYFWLPARRERLFHPIMWTIPGPNWRKTVPIGDSLGLQTSLGNCLSLDIELNLFRTKSCTNVFPSLCFYVNNLHNPAKCPSGFNSVRFTPDHGACYGIAKSDTPEGLSYDDFRNNKCNKPMCDNDIISRFIFKQIAELNALPNDVWCWFSASPHGYSFDSEKFNFQLFEGIINNAGVLGFTNLSVRLPCMACEAEVIYAETELMFEYNDAQNVIYLTIYHPSGLWRYNEDDKGVQCFSNAKGFVKVVNINKNPFINIKSIQKDSDSGQIEKIVYVIDLVTDSSAQYWCEGHTVNFSLITTNRMIVNPRGNQIHVFCLVITLQMVIGDVLTPINLTGITTNITNIFNAQKVLIMDISDNKFDLSIYIVLHLHIEIDDTHEDKALNIEIVYDRLKTTAESELSNYEYTFVNLSSSVYCLPTVSKDKVQLDWKMTPIGHIAAPKQFCLQSNGLPVKRRCEGSYMLGSQWGEIEGNCDSTYEPSHTTAFLYNFLTRPYRYISEFLIEGLTYVLGDTDIIIPADIYYLSVSLQQISDIAQNNVSSIETTNIKHIAWIMDRVTTLDCHYLRLAQTLNSTNVIIDSISDIIEIISKYNINNSKNIDTSKNNNANYKLAVEPQFVVQISYPYFNNITGIAVVCKKTSDKFTNMLINPLYKNTTVEDMLAIKHLEIATWLPTKVMDSLIKLNPANDAMTNDPNLHIIITIYHNDAVFQEIQEESHMVNSRIIGISVPEYISNLHNPIPILFKQLNNATNSFCGYWDFHPQSSNVPGSWKKNGCFVVKTIDDITMCECYHLTHFGQLLVDGRKDDQEHNTGHLVALNLITLIGSFLSLLGIAGIWITALVFSNWRKKAGTKVLLHLSTAISLPLIFVIIFNLQASITIKKNDTYLIATHMKLPCVILGALLHFSILASFMWMLITAVLQFIRYVRVLGVKRPSRFMIKFSLIGWGLPLFPVLLTLALDPLNYIPAPSTIRKICYPSGFYLIFAVLLPVGIILLINIILFISVLHAISRRSNVNLKSTDMDLVGAQLRVSIFLFFLLGLTWVFGLFSFSNNLLWSYLFCLTSTLQGFVLFIYFVICDPSTRGLWVTLMKPQFTTNSSRKSITSITNG